MFGDFLFGEPYFGQPEPDQVPGGVGATATFTGFKLTLSQRPVSVNLTRESSGSGGNFRNVRFIERIQVPGEATATFKGHQLTLRLGKVKVSGAAAAHVKSNRRLSLHSSMPSVMAGSGVRVKGLRVSAKINSPAVYAGATIQIKGKTRGYSEDEELLDIGKMLISILD